ncbi:GDSL-type esterase/lipase family protein [Dyadobacter sandarakinus]|uniref:GDSL family lipase n=1 Tax=Dyadobacter sandarakinus TaxID=2747268 RepID=A0ABX7I5V1_9BACT|nr:GDSL-type esterase/lipase family protein [Dyadobacter sandarakinus]QRR00558.1 GDSL family lipase [Dyadobacter sandarakinus]
MDWYEQEVERVVAERDQLAYKPETIFYGSSSFTKWETLYHDFSGYKPVNLGFGGSTLAACCWFFDRIVAPLPAPQRIVIYAGDNDLGDGRNPEEVFIFYRDLMRQITEVFGEVPCYYISIKPSLQRWNIIGAIRELNRLIQDEVRRHESQHYIDITQQMLTAGGTPDPALFEEDGLHLSPKGYTCWTRIIKAALGAPAQP